MYNNIESDMAVQSLNLTDNQRMILKGKICPYCGKPTEYVDSSEIYGKSFGMIYLCRDCRAYVGVHKGTDESLGRLADSMLRDAKKEVHFYFDQIWKLGYKSRKEAYFWLSKMLGIPTEYTHIGMFSEKTCKEVVYLSKQFLNDSRRLDMDFGVEPKTPYYDY